MDNEEIQSNIAFLHDYSIDVNHREIYLSNYIDENETLKCYLYMNEELLAVDDYETNKTYLGNYLTKIEIKLIIK